jgi:phosphoglycolate phosphatase-like HAD superfamily hydrolase
MLYIFDLDGTLVESFGIRPLPGVQVRLTLLVQQGYPLAIATNQAGVAWRAQMKRLPYPLPTELGARFDEIAGLLPPLQEAVWFAAIHDDRVRLSDVDYAALVEAFLHANRTLKLFVSAQPDWRKPQPGMLLAACQHHGVPPGAAIYVGDMESDAEAATTAGMAFITAEAFFAAGTPSTEATS